MSIKKLSKVNLKRLAVVLKKLKLYKMVSGLKQFKLR